MEAKGFRCGPIVYGHRRYRATLPFRHALLRRPLGRHYPCYRARNERKEFIFGRWDEQGELVACVLLRPLGGRQARLRQMAVARHQQGYGHGHRLLRWVENWARGRGFRNLEMHARQHVLPFYRRIGYHPVKGPFREVGILHHKMVRHL